MHSKSSVGRDSGHFALIFGRKLERSLGRNLDSAFWRFSFTQHPSISFDANVIGAGWLREACFIVLINGVFSTATPGSELLHGPHQWSLFRKKKSSSSSKSTIVRHPLRIATEVKYVFETANNWITCCPAQSTQKPRPSPKYWREIVGNEFQTELILRWLREFAANEKRVNTKGNWDSWYSIYYTKENDHDAHFWFRLEWLGKSLPWTPFLPLSLSRFAWLSRSFSRQKCLHSRT